METNEILSRLPGLLLPWFRENARVLPWRQDREPYHVWLSEVMLQQTRVEAVKGYYQRFLQELPDVEALANAAPDRLNKLWEGLGYYSRVRNLQAAAKQIMADFDGKFPGEYEKIRSLKGIGDYTAGAIASICFEQPTPAVDGNVLRAVTRLTEDSRPITDEKTKQSIRRALAEVYPAGHCGDFTQSLMELGAIVCLPNGAPECERCPVASLCRAGQSGAWRTLPVKAAKKERRLEKLTVFVMDVEGAAAVRRRKSSGLLAGLWEFPNVPGHLTVQQALHQAEEWGVRPKEIVKEIEREHIFTHVQWQMRCFYMKCGERPAQFIWASEQMLDSEIALPTAFRMFRE